MKKLLQSLAIPVLCLLLSSGIKAQVTSTFGPEIGVAASGLYDSYNEEVLAGINIQAGGTAHIQFGRFFAIRPSVLLKFGEFKNPDYFDISTTLTRISIPIAIMFSKNFENDNQLYVGAGPHLMYAISGKSNNYNNYIDLNKRKMNFGNSTTDDMKPLDFGAHLKAGFNFNRGLSLSLFFNVGLTNIDPKGTQYKTQTLDALGFSFAWMFGGNNE